MKEKVVVKLPIRINFGGAWSDTPPFCINEGGCVCNASATINNKRPIVVKIEKINKEKIVIENENQKTEILKLEELENINIKDKFALEKICLKIVNTKVLGFKISISTKDIPRGSGLGTSSILALAIIKALYKFNEKTISDKQLIKQVLEIEKRLGTGGGWQDQAGAIKNGIKLITSKPGEIQNLKIEKIIIPEDAKKELKERFALVYTGETRESKEIVQSIMTRYLKDKKQKQKIVELKKIAIEMKEELEKGNIDKFAKLLNKNYEISKTLNEKIVNKNAQKIFHITNEITSGKMICGAGNGGFVELILKKGITKKQLQEMLEKEFSNNGISQWEVELE